MANKVTKSEPTASIERQFRVGFFVFGTLIVLKLVEYFVSKIIPVGDWPYLTVLALCSAALIIYFYKHIKDLWRSEGTSDDK
jgi:hypothetical protein